MAFCWISFVLLIRTIARTLKAKILCFLAGITQLFNNILGRSLYLIHHFNGTVNIKYMQTNHLYRALRLTLWFKLSNMALITMFFLSFKCKINIRISQMDKQISIPMFTAYFFGLHFTFPLNTKLWYFSSQQALMMDQ